MKDSSEWVKEWQIGKFDTTNGLNRFVQLIQADVLRYAALMVRHTDPEARIGFDGEAKALETNLPKGML